MNKPADETPFVEEPQDPASIAEIVLAAHLVISRLAEGIESDEMLVLEHEPIALLADAVDCIAGALRCLLEAIVAQWRAGALPELSAEQLEALQIAEQILTTGTSAAESDQ